jgi:hypothetical protein
MSEVVVVQVTQPVVQVTAPGPQGSTGPAGNVPIFTRQNEISPVVGLTRYYFDGPATINQIRASVGIPSQGSSVVVDTLVNGVSIGTTTIAANSNTATRTLSRAVVANDYVTVSILSVGSAYSGSDLTLVLTIN